MKLKLLVVVTLKAGATSQLIECSCETHAKLVRESLQKQEDEDSEMYIRIIEIPGDGS